MMAVMATVPHLRDPFIRRTGSGFEVWADEYVPNQPGAASTARALGADAGELLRHATAADAPLGARSRSHPASRESLFTLHGPAQVRVTPDDDRCIAAEVATAGGDGPPRLTAAVYSATRRPV